MSAEQGQMLADMVWRVVAVGVVLWLVGAAFIAYVVKTKNQALIERFYAGVGVVSESVFKALDWVYQRVARWYVPFMVGFSVGVYMILAGAQNQPGLFDRIPPVQLLPVALALLVLIPRLWFWALDWGGLKTKPSTGQAERADIVLKAGEFNRLSRKDIRRLYDVANAKTVIIREESEKKDE